MGLAGGRNELCNGCGCSRRRAGLVGSGVQSNYLVARSSKHCRRREPPRPISPAQPSFSWAPRACGVISSYCSGIDVLEVSCHDQAREKSREAVELASGRLPRPASWAAVRHLPSAGWPSRGVAIDHGAGQSVGTVQNHSSPGGFGSKLPCRAIDQPTAHPYYPRYLACPAPPHRTNYRGHAFERRLLWRNGSRCCLSAFQRRGHSAYTYYARPRASIHTRTWAPRTWHMIGLPHMSANAQPETDASPSPTTTGASSSMETKEGRIGNAFACERCRKHKVRPTSSDPICIFSH